VGSALTATKAFGKGDRQMMRAVKATLLVTALARFTVIAVRAGFKHLGQMYLKPSRS
jgi:hypothetical protein